MSLPWKPAAALPHFANPTTILIAQIDANGDAFIDGIFVAHGNRILSDDDNPPRGSSWRWVEEWEALLGCQSIDAAPAPELDDDFPPELLARAEAFASGSLMTPETHVHILARAPKRIGMVERVELIGTRIEYGLVMAPGLVRIGRDWVADDGAVAIYEEFTGTALASGSDADSARCQLAALIRAIGGDEAFKARLRTVGAIVPAAVGVEMAGSAS